MIINPVFRYQPKPVMPMPLNVRSCGHYYIAEKHWQDRFLKKNFLIKANTKNNFSNHLLLGYTAYSGVPGVHRCSAVVAHNEDFAVRHLIGVGDIGTAKG